ncbi:MAG: acyltransferase family protein [Methanoregula sp.]|nr:MAG: acyltransferase family protein [Methanoregula sp.]
MVEIDLLKGMAIIAVVLHHTLSVSILLAIGAPFYIYHSVPLLILIAGFTGTYAYMRRNYTTISQCYDAGLLYRRFRRLIIPYVMIFLLQIAIIHIIFHNSFDMGSLVYSFLTGGYGLGAYFVPVIIQSILIVPILYLLALRNPYAMLVGAFVFDLAMEYLAYISVIPLELYYVLYAQFLFAGALGVWLALSARRLTLWIAILGFFSAVYIWITYYTQLFTPFFETNIVGVISQAPAYFWTCILALTGLMFLPKKAETWFYRGLANVGKASWHIFLVQMTFFFLWQPLAEKVLFPFYNLFPTAISFVGISLIALVTITICSGTGYLWYVFESSWTNSGKPKRKTPSQ